MPFHAKNSQPVTQFSVNHDHTYFRRKFLYSCYLLINHVLSTILFQSCAKFPNVEVADYYRVFKDCKILVLIRNFSFSIFMQTWNIRAHNEVERNCANLLPFSKTAEGAGMIKFD